MDTDPGEIKVCVCHYKSMQFRTQAQTFREPPINLNTGPPAVLNSSSMCTGIRCRGIHDGRYFNRKAIRRSTTRKISTDRLDTRSTSAMALRNCARSSARSCESRWSWSIFNVHKISAEVCSASFIPCSSCTGWLPFHRRKYLLSTSCKQENYIWMGVLLQQ